jgi:hypothetical protein
MRGWVRALLCGGPLLVTVGCLPVIAHPPHVESGSHFSLAGGFTVGPLTNRQDSVHVLAPMPSFGVRESYGLRSSRDADGAAVELGAELIFLTGFAADAYVQAPPRWTGETDLGIGAALLAGAFRGPMIYAQAGHRISDDYYLFTTQGLARFTRGTNLSTGNNRPAISWQPTIAIEPLRAWSRVRYYFVTATVGRTFNGCVQVFLGCNESSGASIAIGVAMSRPPEPPR